LKVLENIRGRNSLKIVFVTAFAVTALAGFAAGGDQIPPSVFTGVLTFHNDNARDGVNSLETILTPNNVNSAQFGKMFSYPVDGYIYAQPLYVPNVAIPKKGIHNVVYIATEHDSVYAFDADGLNTAPLWQKSFIKPTKGVTTVPSSDTGSNDIVPEIGITSTPVIDTASKTLYVVAKTKIVNLKTHKIAYQQRIHALALTTGAEKLGGPKLINPVMLGTGAGNANGKIPFDALRENQRAGLLLSNGIIYIAFASHGDNPPYHGLVIAYGAARLTLLGVFNNTPNGSDGGIWQAGNGPAADAQGNIYVASGNGTFDFNDGGRDLGDSIVNLHFKRGSGFSVQSYFTPWNQAFLSSSDLDFGDSGVMLLPDQSVGPIHLAVTGGKDGVLYIVNRDDMGGFNSTTNDNRQIVQELADTFTHGFFAVPAFFDGTMYICANEDFLKGFQLNAGLFPSNPNLQTTMDFNFPGTSPAISANDVNNTIVWALKNEGYQSNSPTVLYAFDRNLNQLYDSTQAANDRDQAGGAVKFTVPTIASGRVYVGTESELDVYGVLPN
jgi:hypothetical protein